MKKTLLFLSTLLATLALVIGLTVSASAEDVIHSGTGDDLSWTLNETTGELIISGEGEIDMSFEPLRAYKSSIKAVVINNGVTSIGEYAFYGCTELTSVTIPDSVTSIGYSAFCNCTGLTNITIPNSVTHIESDAFRGCSSLISIIVQEGNTVYHSIGNCLIETGNKELMLGCKNSIIPTDSSVTSIGHSAFYGCTGLTSITIPDSVTRIGDVAFWDCSSLIGITIPDSVTSIGRSAFSGCTGLTSITVQEGNTVYHSIGNCIIETGNKELMLGCKNSIIPTDSSVTSIGHSAFYGCTGLTSITIPDSVTSIGHSAFYGCTGLTSITIPDSVTRIGSYAFRSCTGLTSVTIPDSVTSIGDFAFEGCPFTSVTMPTSAISLIPQTNLRTVILTSGTSIGDMAFYRCTGLTNITIPDSVTSIGDSTFSGCTGLTNITIPDSVTSIGDSAFYGCTGLTSLTIPDSVTSIDLSVFSGCTGLTSITIPNSITSIGHRAFSGCTGLISITIPDSVTSIGLGAFSDCTGLTSITIPNSVKSIGSTAFNGCTNLESIFFCGTEAKWLSYNIPLGNYTVFFHKWNDGETTTPSTHNETGIKTYICTACGETKLETVEKLGHVYDNDQDESCNVCGDVRTVETQAPTTSTETPSDTGSQAPSTPETPNGSDEQSSDSQTFGCGASLSGGLGLFALLMGAAVGLSVKKKKQ